MIANENITVKAGGVRLDAALLSAFPSTTRAFARQAIEAGTVLVNGRSTVKGLKLKGGEKIEIIELLEAEDNLVLPDGSCPRPVFEDASLLAFDKPAGIPVQPLNCRETGTLMNRVVTRYPECRPLGDRPLMAGALHRIDADTSGLVLVARTGEAFDILRRQFTEQTVEKTYLALVEGAVAAGGTLENDLIHDPSLPFCRMIDISRLRSGGRRDLKPLHAVTNFRPLGYTTVENEERTLLEVKIFTGVTHQIRAQLAMAGMHIVNDRLYGAFAVENHTGHCLHSLSAKFTHPLSKDPVVIETPLPEWAKFPV